MCTWINADIVWPLIDFFKPTSALMGAAYWGRRWSGIRGICHKHLRKWTFFTSSTDLSPSPSALCLTSLLPTRLFQETRVIFQRYLWSRIFSLCMSLHVIDHVYKLQSNTEKTSVKPIGILVVRRISDS